MKRLFLLVLGILVISSPVAAQESSAPPTDRLSAATPGRAEKTSPTALGPPGFLVKNGKVYISMLGRFGITHAGRRRLGMSIIEAGGADREAQRTHKPAPFHIEVKHRQ